jgi:hypothetical protein
MSKSGISSSGAFGMVPMLDGTNWMVWSSKITSLLMAEGLWDIMEGMTPKPSPKEKEAAKDDESNEMHRITKLSESYA